MKYTTEQETLREHLKSMAEKAKAWVAEDPENRMASIVDFDDAELDYLASRNITSVEAFELDEVRNDFWEKYKDVNGISPRHMDVWNMTMEEIQEEMKLLQK
jgi:hypothetical protein